MEINWIVVVVVCYSSFYFYYYMYSIILKWFFFVKLIFIINNVLNGFLSLFINNIVNLYKLRKVELSDSKWFVFIVELVIILNYY